jgi:hypothetical protein
LRKCGVRARNQRRYGSERERLIVAVRTMLEDVDGEEKRHGYGEGCPLEGWR